MQMLPRFYAPEATALDADVALPADEARHLRQVLRLSVGAEIVVFDGRGREFLARVVEAGRARVSVRPLEPRRPVEEPRVHVTLAVGALKANHLDAVVRDATMLGVAVIQPLVTGRTNVPGSALRRPEVVERWRRIAIASAKQSRRAVLPAIRAAAAFAEFVGDDQSEARLIFVEPGAASRVQGAGSGVHDPPHYSVRVGPHPHAPLLLGSKTRSSQQPQALGPRAGPAPRTAAILIGPEGGWTDDEVRLAASGGFQLATLGGLTLCADAVPIVAIAALRTAWGDW